MQPVTQACAVSCAATGMCLCYCIHPLRMPVAALDARSKGETLLKPFVVGAVCTSAAQGELASRLSPRECNGAGRAWSLASHTFAVRKAATAAPPRELEAEACRDVGTKVTPPSAAARGCEKVSSSSPFSVS